MVRVLNINQVGLSPDFLQSLSTDLFLVYVTTAYSGAR